MSVEGRLEALGRFVQKEDPFGRIQGRVFLDAQPVIQWMRLGILEKVLDLLPFERSEPRFQIQDRAFREVVGVVSGKFATATPEEVADHLHGLPNLLIDDPIPASTPLGSRVLELQERCFLEAGEDPAKYSPKRHLGEAETLAVMELLAPGAVFVTADKGAIETALSTGISRPAHPFAFAGGVMLTLDDVTGFWEFTCYGRECVFVNEWNPECVEALECSDFTEEAAERSPIHRDLLRAEDALKWMLQDLKSMASTV